MDRTAIPPAVEAERLGVADLLDGLDPASWRAPSLCAGWTVQDVVGHLCAATRLTTLGAVGAMLRARGNIDRMIADSARTRAAAYSPAELVAQLRENAGSTSRPPGAKAEDTLVDILVHGQDIARPLGLTRAMPADRVVTALAHVWGASFYGARKRFGDLRLVATDMDWSAGEGPDEVRGPGGEMLLLVTGRPAALDGVEGPGRDAAAARLER